MAQQRLTQAPREELLRLLRATPRLNEDQVWPPDADWRTWVLLGGRGSGKTFAGGFWMNELARAKDRTFALVGPALHDVREVMVEGPSGLKAQAPGDNRPRWEAGRRRLVWPSGAAAYAFSVEDPDSLRGPQFYAAWADEFCAWRNIEATLSNLRFGLRLGADPKLAITTTPRPIPALRRLLLGLVLATVSSSRTKQVLPMSARVPDVAANSLSIAFGDFARGYLIVDRAGVRVLRDPYSAKPYMLLYTTIWAAIGR